MNPTHIHEARNPRPQRLLLFGYLPPPIGGVRLLFRQLVRELETMPAVRCRVVSLTGRHRNTIARAWSLLRAGGVAAFRLPRCDVVSLHPTNTALAVLGPWIFVLSRLFRKPMLVRKFGGDFANVFARWPGWLRFTMSRTVLRAELWMFETRTLCNAFAPLCPRVERFPNSRPFPARIPAPPSGPPRRIVFLGHMRRIKGIADIYRLAAVLPEGFTCHLYGPLGFDITRNHIAEWERSSPARYIGELAPDEVPATLDRYHWLLLPARPETGTAVEGHPGVIIEAMGRGLPVIASCCGGISEILDDSCGMLVEPGDMATVARVLPDLAIRPGAYERLREGARRRAALYDSGIWSERFVEICRELSHVG